jgi:hypothetical protein
MSSGFIYNPHDTKDIYFITAGHEMKDITALIETNIKKDGKPLLLNTGNFKIFLKGKEIDYSFSKFPDGMLTQKEGGNENGEIIVYKNRFVKAIKDEAYGFAVSNNYMEFLERDNKLVLPIYECFEVYMDLVRQTKHINYFKPSRPIQSDEYYRGASGSPIADPSGAINSILIGRTPKNQWLRAFRLDNIDFQG